MRFFTRGATASLSAALVLNVSAGATSVSTSKTSSYPRLCGAACQNTLQTVRFADEEVGSPPAKGGRFCASGEEDGGMLLQSLYLCLRVQECGGDDSPLVAELRRTCADPETGSGALLPSYAEVVGRWTDDDVGRMRRFNESAGTGKGRVLDEVAVPEDHFFYLWWRTMHATEYNNWYHHSYGLAMCIFWAAVAAFGLVHNIASMVSLGGKSGRPSASPRSPIVRGFSGWNWLKSRLLIPATFGRRCAESLGPWGTVPPRVQSLTISLFVVLNIVTSIHGYEIFPGNMYYPSITDQVLRFVSDRTGIISFYNFPLIWLFGMRNNVVMWLTGWDFGTYNNFHRWVARVATLQAVIHSIGYTILILREGGFQYYIWWYSYLFWWGGVLATIFMCALVGFSFYFIRRQHYELFLVVHIVLSILVLLTMLGHVSIFLGEYDALVWVPVVIWAADRVFRGLRIVAFNYKFWNTKALATFNPDTNIVRLEVPCSRSIYKPSPGTYFYITVFSLDANFWESHPFTLAGVTDARGARKVDYDTTPPSDGESSPLLMPTMSNDTEALSELSGRDDKASRLVFLIRPYDDFTAKLRDLAASPWPKAADVRVLVDGPYGHSQPLHRFTRVVFVVGGSGVVVPLSYLSRPGRRTGKSEEASLPRYGDVHIHWSVREPGLAVDVLSRDLGTCTGGAGDAASCESIEVNLYLTGSSTLANLQVPGGDVGFETRYIGRRMDAGEIVRGAAAGMLPGQSLAVVACGPARMADQARAAAAEAIAASRGVDVSYFEESFQW